MVNGDGGGGEQLEIGKNKNNNKIARARPSLGLTWVKF
jgi:hypothetical protein